MKEQWIKAKEWWANLATRERQMLSIGGVVVGIFLFYELIWSPYLTHIDDLRSKIASGETLLQWMERTDQAIKRVESTANHEKQATSPVALLSALQKEIASSGLDQALTQLKQTSNETVLLEFQKVAFDKLVVLLTDIAKTQPVAVTQMSAVGDKAPGIVDAEITLKLG